MVVHWCLDSSRRDKYIDEHKCIAEMADGEMRDFLVERSRPAPRPLARTRGFGDG